MLQPNFFNTVFVFPILNVLVFLYKVFLFIKIPGALGFAIVGLTVLVRLLLHPFFKHQIETAKKIQELKPHLDKLAKKHKNDKQRLQQEQLKLYQQAGVNPASGCLFMILQFPIFIALYNTLSLFLSNGNNGKIIDQINSVVYTPLLKIQSVNPWFFGFNLAISPAKAGQWHYYLIPLLTVILQYFQTQAMTPQTPTETQSNLKVKTDGKISSPKKEEDDFQKAMSTQMKIIFPIMIGWFSYSLPVGLSLYWNIFSIFSILQYKQIKNKI
ncbi:MAG: YidC/Oxa1 family membrane protein insertase [Microgenomates group bacterium]